MDRIEKQIIRALSWRPMSVWELMNYQDAHVVKYFSKLKSMIDKGLITQKKDGKLTLTDSAPTMKPVERLVCGGCDGKGINIKGTFFQEVYDKFVEMTKDRPRPEEQFDQGFIRPIDTIGRIAFAYERGDIEDTDILIVGDDDLLGIALALTGMPRRVFMIDIDQRLIDYEKKKAEELGFNLDASTWDARKELPSNLKGSFDVFFTDPPETDKAWKTFISRSVSGLRGVGSSGYFGFTHRESSNAKWRRFQRLLTDMGFAVTDIIRDFNVYPEDQYKEGFWDTWPLWKMLPVKATHTPENWYTSALVRIEAVDEIKPVVTGDIDIVPEFYYDDESIVTPRVG